MRWNIAAFFALFLTLGATAWAAFAATKAAVAADNAVVMADDTSKRQLRAYLGMTEVSISGLAPGKTTKLRYVFTNSGQTPAYSVRSVSMSIITDEAPEDYRFLFSRHPSWPVIESESDVGPGGTIRAENVVSREMTQDLVNSIMAGTLKIVLGGIIIYIDAFGRTRRGVFRTYVDPAHIKKKGRGKLLNSARNNNSN